MAGGDWARLQLHAGDHPQLLHGRAGAGGWCAGWCGRDGVVAASYRVVGASCACWWGVADCWVELLVAERSTDVDAVVALVGDDRRGAGGWVGAGAAGTQAAPGGSTAYWVVRGDSLGADGTRRACGVLS